MDEDTHQEKKNSEEVGLVAAYINTLPTPIVSAHMSVRKTDDDTHRDKKTSEKVGSVALYTSTPPTPIDKRSRMHTCMRKWMRTSIQIGRTVMK